MSQRHIPSRLRAARVASAPAGAGHRPVLLAIALAAAFTPLPGRAQPSGAQVIHGAATFSQQGNHLLVTTQNGAGTAHSAINWQSFSIPAGASAHFAQPGVTSTSINRVVGHNPSAIFGTLSSNGHLVLVNPAGIAVGAGAVVDTAGFTASTLRMSEADAIAGRLRFGDGSLVGPLRVDGHVLARAGDVVLVGTDVQAGSQAVVQSPNGATILAAGQKVELTGRGLEGISFQLQAPSDQAVNLGTLQGDAVGLFAGTLRHSGLVQASAATVEGGRVVLKAAHHAEAGGATTAQGAGGKGGQVDVLGRTVGVMAGAVIDASGAAGGGQVRVGGDYKGGNPDVPNAQVTYVAPDAQIRASARQRGNGGKVIVWADDTTRMFGSIEANGGPAGGDGGFIETSGKRYLDVGAGKVSARAPNGKAGTWLLDPSEIWIVAAPLPTPDPTAPPVPPEDLGNGPNFVSATDSSRSVVTVATLNNALNSFGTITVATDGGGGSGSGDIIFSSAGGPTLNIQTTASGTATLRLQAQNDIRFESGTSTNFQALGPTGSRLNVEFDAGMNGAGGAVVTDAGAAVQANTFNNANFVDLRVAAGDAWNNSGSLVLNLNGKLDLSAGAAFTNDGSVTGATGAAGGVSGGSFSGSGTVNLTEGSFSVDTLDVGGDFRLAGKAFSAGSFDFAGSSLDLQVSSGGLALGTGGAVSAAGAVRLVAQNGSVLADRELMAERVTVSAGPSGSIDITGNVTTRGASSDPDSGSVKMSAGGSIAFEQIYTSSTGGNLPDGGDVTLSAGGQVQGFAIQTGGGDYAGASGGNVKVAAGAGGVDISFIGTSSGWSTGARAGDVDVVATGGGAVRLGYVNADGDDHGYGKGGAGGSVAIRTVGGGDITIDSGEGGGISAIGGYSNGSLGGAGGGMVVLTSSGKVTVHGRIDVRGGDGEDGSPTLRAGAGGSVQITAAGDVEVMDAIDAAGGYGTGSLGGGMGGMVKVVTPGSIIAGQVDASGGSSDEGPGGHGHANGVQLAAGQDIQLGALDVFGGSTDWGPSGGNAAPASLTFGGDLVVEYIDANGGDGGDRDGTGGSGGRGSDLAIMSTSGDLDLSGLYLDVSGGRGGDGAAGGRGGNGGSLSLTALAGGVILPQFEFLTARGGNGGEADGATTNASGRGGDGGAIHITAAGASQLLGYLDAGGGGGGDADYLGTSVGGSGGNGGLVNVSVGGALQLGGWIGAGGGYAGEAADYEAPYPYPSDPARAGAEGAMGFVNIAAAGGIVVPAPSPTLAPDFKAAVAVAPSPTSAPPVLQVEGHWTNPSTLAVAPGAVVITSSDFINTGSVLLAQDAVFTVGHSYDAASGTYSYGDAIFANRPGALLAGSGTVQGHVFNQGTVAPGGPAGIGRLSVSGQFVQSATGRLDIDIAANSPFYPGATYDQLHVGGQVGLDGQLFVNGIPAVTLDATQLRSHQAVQLETLPTATTYYEVISASAASGQFSLISGPPALVSEIRMNIGGSVVEVPGGRAGGLLAAIAALLPGVSIADIQKVITESTNNSISGTDEVSGNDDEDDTAEGASDIVVTDEACKPS